jgi:hypothetical protein
MNKTTSVLMAASMLLLALPFGWAGADGWALVTYKVADILPIYIGLQFPFSMRNRSLAVLATASVLLYTAIDIRFFLPASFMEISLGMKILFVAIASMDLIKRSSRSAVHWSLLVFVLIQGGQELLISRSNLWLGYYYYLTLIRVVAFIIFVLLVLELFRSKAQHEETLDMDAYEE